MRGGGISGIHSKKIVIPTVTNIVPVKATQGSVSKKFGVMKPLSG
jgi:hypothetical protein